MKDTCVNCPDFAKCKGMCDKILLQVEEPEKPSGERPISSFGDGYDQNGEKEDISAKFDKLMGIDPASKFQDANDTNINWRKTLPQPEAAEIEESERKVLMDAIKIATRRDNLKLHRRFHDFLMCEKIVRIAARSGTTKQNIQKQFQLIVTKTYRTISKKKDVSEAAITPLRFKKKVNLTDLRRYT